MDGGAKVEFWFDFASTYSYLTAMRIGDLAAQEGVGVTWKPFLLGPVFMQQGWRDSPFNIYPAKGAYMWRDMARIAGERKLAFVKPGIFPQKSLLAARTGLVGEGADWLAPFCIGVFRAAFEDDQDISNPEILTALLEGLGVDATAVLDLANAPENKTRLRQRGERAQELGIFGAPSLIADGELFWGDDRLEQAIRWAQRGRSGRN